MQIAVIVVGAVIAVAALCWIYRRPQRGVLLLAALTPLHGLLAIAPVPGIASAWKEGLVLVTAVFAWIHRGVAARHPGPRLHLPWWPAAAIFVAYGTVSGLAFFGIAGVVATKVTFFYLTVVGILWLTPFDARDRDVLVSVIMGMGALATVVGIVQQIVGPGALVNLGYEFGQQVRTTGGFFRTFSTFNQPFGFGLYVMMALLVGGAVALAEPRRRRNLLFLCFSPVMAAAMATSVVRAAILGLLVGVIWLTILRFRALAWPLVAVAALGAVTLPLLPSGASKIFFSSSSLGQRGSGWSDIISSILVHPVGQGLGASGAAADRISTAEGTATQAVSTAGGVAQGMSSNYQPDNYYVKMLLELGPLGLWAFLALIVTALIWCVQLSRRIPGRDGALALGVSASIVAAMVASLVATYFEIFPLDVYFWLLLGVMGCAAAQHSSHSVRSHSDPGEVESRPTSVSS